MSFPQQPLNAANYLPYQTTSQQAMETLAGGVGFGAPRHQQSRSNSSTSPTTRKDKKNNKKKKGNRFGCFTCGGNADLYDEGLNTSFVASSSPGEKVIGRMRAGSSSQVAMPSIEFFQVKPQSPPSNLVGLKRPRSKTSSGEARTDSDDQSAGPPSTPPVPLRQATQDILPAIKMSPTETLSGSYDDDGSFSATSFSPTAQVMTAVRANISETAFKELDLGVGDAPTQTLALQRTTQPLSIHLKQEEAVADSPGVVRTVSTIALPCHTPTLPPPRRRDEDAVVEAPPVKTKRRGGFIAMPPSDVPGLDLDEYSHVPLESSSSSLAPYHSANSNDSKILLHNPSRSSLASSTSKYSTSSPYLETKSTPCRATMGGLAESSMPHHHIPLQQSNHSATDTTPESTGSRNSAASSYRTLSTMPSPSIQESDHSPAIGEVLSHFPTLTGMAAVDGNFSSSPYHSSEADMSDNFISNRINTFGPGLRQCNDKRDDLGDGDGDSPARVNSFHYDEELTFQLQRRQLSFSSLASPDTSPASTPSSVDSYSTLSSNQSRRSHKRTAVLCGYPSQGNLAALRLRTETEGDLTWEERLLSFSKEAPSSGDAECAYILSNDDGSEGAEQDEGDVTIRTCSSNQTLRSPLTGGSSSTATNTTRGRISSNGPAPFSPPPDLPLPPVPSPSAAKRRGQHVRSSNSFINTNSYQSRPQYHYRSTAASLPRSVTCPDLADQGYAF